MEYTVLIVEDNQIALESLRRTIPWEELGLRLVGTADNGRQGSERIEQLRPDIILADIHMPEMDGLSMVERMLFLKLQEQNLLSVLHGNAQGQMQS